MKIGYLYYTFYPVTGGASVHGYYLAKELKKLGYELVKLNGEPDPWTTRLKNPVTGFFRMLRECDLIYVRMDYFLNPRNFLGLMAILTGKKVIVELNSPSDELYLFGRSKKYISRIDKIMAAILKRADSVIVVSCPIKAFCETELGLKNVQVIENGGVRFETKRDDISDELKEKIGQIRNRFERVIVWSGSANDMQDLELLHEIADAQRKTSALLIIAKDENKRLEQLEASGNVFLFRQLQRKEVEFLIDSADIGLAFYGDYSWSRWGFYNSSLKIFEFLNNGLFTITNRPGTKVQQSYPNFKYARNWDEILTFIESFEGKKEILPSARTWEDVAEETSNRIRKVTGK